MSRKKRENLIHTDVLIPSDMGVVNFAQVIEENFLTVCEYNMKLRGEELPIPSSLDKDLLRWRGLRVRHKQGDFRHTTAEYESMKVIAQWTVDVNNELHNQPPNKIEWR